MTKIRGDFLTDSDITGIDMPNWDLNELASADAEITEYDGNSVTIRSGDHTFLLGGRNFAFVIDGGDVHLAAGTITHVTVLPAGPTATPPRFEFAIKDFQMDVGDFNDFVANDDVTGFQRALFDGADKMVGGAGIDTLTGLGGRDFIAGGDGNDALVGGHGRDLLQGDRGADYLRGGAGNDLFVFNNGYDSSDGAYDVIGFLKVGCDRIVTPDAVTHVDAPVDAGVSDSFNVDPTLGAALGNSFVAHHAVVATVVVDISPDDPTQPNPPAFLETFLVVDVNGVAGYQSGEDLAIRIEHSNGLENLSVDDFLGT
jgi:Ca2+-binding RTX toxin-like protein